MTELKTSRFGYEVLTDPLLNKGTAFTNDERDAFELHGLLPPNVSQLEQQILRRMQVLRSLNTDLDRYVFMRELQDNNEILFYAVLTQHIEELLPIVYTPTIGEGCQHFSRLFRKPRGLFLSMPHQDLIPKILNNARFDSVEAIVVTDGERILGLGDQGAGGMGIPIGKLSLYTACAGLHPITTLPIFLDAGTDNENCLRDPLYVGWRHHRVRGQEYDNFIDAFVQAVIQRWPNVLLQWEDFAKDNATRLLERYQDKLCTFNDDIQGTAAMVLGTLLAAIQLTQISLKKQKIIIFGAGSAGCGIANLLLQAIMEEGLTFSEAKHHLFLIDRDGLLMENSKNIYDFQKKFLQTQDTIAHWQLENPNKISLYDVIKNIQPTALIGTSGQANAFDERIVKLMASQTTKPIIFPLSNPSHYAEATPNDLMHWTEGRAIIGTGSPFPPIIRHGKPFIVDQTNNSYIFPGLGLGTIAIGAKRITESMLIIAAKALAESSPARENPNNNLLPRIADLRNVAKKIAIRVAEFAYQQNLCDKDIRNTIDVIETSDKDEYSASTIQDLIESKIWQPKYLPFQRITLLDVLKYYQY